MVVKNLNNSNNKKGTEKISNNFGKKGWGVIIYVGFLYYFMTGMTVDGLNVLVPGLSELHGMDYNQILAMSTPAGIIALISCMFYGWLAAKKGAQFTAILCLVLGGFATIWYGNANTLTTYAISLTLMVSLINGFSNIAGNVYMANWFPRTKGLALGWSTMGMNMASATIVIVLNALAVAFGGINTSVTIMGIIMILLAIFTKIFMKGTPEEAGCTPDNLPSDQVSEEIIGNYEHKLTYMKVFKTKETWLMAIAYGINGMVTIGIMSQLVPRLMERGYELNTAIMMLTIAAVIGLLGSYAWGVVDQKWGTKTASLCFAVWYIVGIGFNLIDNTICLYISLIMIGGAIGGNANFPPSMVTTIFGRREFPMAFTVMNTIQGVIRNMAFLVLAVAISITGSFTGAYIIFMGIEVISIIAMLLLNDKPKEI
ncbi:OFA family oxalate/formate antiporter-like MFS transporter [Sedimentibacter acidaminivorans]|uniref:OFA family oxalate/formate antiporter-like MFS transporter n=1 Tax=Sedimentibacter acidaminivorans TaxID=913099 RepID=A0ABS4GDT9_9FIRM|nr:MFS transporter [Sedimentibacter acidaminivorans]MBP1925809.1 OFA family oxalate/formate antiporter-like MFS transporter [Sedimentibacter acidaminivorans]